MKKLVFVCLLFFTTYSTSFSQNVIPNVGDLIATNEIRSRFAIARVETDKEMCSPAVLVGPRVFLTAAHCTPLIASNGLVKVYGPGFEKTVHVEVISMPVIADEDFFEGETCKSLIQSLPDSSTLSADLLAKCWFKDGAADIALLVSDQDI